MNPTVDKAIHKENSIKLIVKSGFRDELIAAIGRFNDAALCRCIPHEVYSGMPMLLAVLSFVTLAVLLRSTAHSLIVRGLRAPRLAHQRVPEHLALQAQSVRLPVGAGKMLFAWFVPVPGASRSPAVLLMHGWGANASLMLPAVAPLHAAGYAVLLLDARCHGNSDDEPFTSLPRFAQDIEAGLNWLQLQPAVDGTRLAVIGHSVGAAAALLSATRRTDMRAVVSLGAFAHPYEVMRRYLTEFHIPYPVIGWYVLRHVQRVIGARFDDIAPINTIPQARCPVLLVHGVDDEVVPFNDAQRLQNAGRAGTVECVAIRGGHDPSAFSADYQAPLINFLQRSFLIPQNTPTITNAPILL